MVQFDTSASSDDTPHNHQNINTTDGLKSRTESYCENFVTVVDENISSQIISQFASRIVSNKRALVITILDCPDKTLFGDSSSRNSL